ncbi:MAG: hypothetical protein AABX93_02780 [Nanoarchaeota archaeon]
MGPKNGKALEKVLAKKSTKKKPAKSLFVFSGKIDAVERAKANAIMKIYEIFARKTDLLPIYVVAPTKDTARDKYFGALYPDYGSVERIDAGKRIESMIQIQFN